MFCSIYNFLIINFTYDIIYFRKEIIMKAILKKSEIFWYILIGIVAILLFYIIRHLWNWDLTVPFDYGGDVVGILQVIKTMIRGDSIFNIEGIAAPFGSNRMTTLFDGSLHYIFFYILAKITNSVGLTINLYFILTFAFSADCCYFLLRRLNISKVSSFVLGLAYAFIPGHLLRGQSHLFIGSSFILPLACLSVIYLINGEFCKDEFALKERLNFKDVLRSIQYKKMIYSLIMLSLLTLSTLYYGMYIAIIIAFATLYIVIEKKQLRHIFYTFLMYLSIAFSAIIAFIPLLIYKLNSSDFISNLNSTRSMEDVETYGLKLVQLLLPIIDHRIPLFAKLSRGYLKFPLVNENYMSSLGILLSCGFLIGIFCIFFKFFHNSCLIVKISKLNLFIFLVATIGGFSSIIGMVNYSLRCFNRYSFFIGIFSAIIIGIILDKINNIICNLKIKGKLLGNKKFYNYIKALCICILIIGIILDQTPSTIGLTKEFSEKQKEIYYNDNKFVSQIEKHEGKNAMVLVLPMSYGLEGTIGRTSTGLGGSYEEYKMYFHSNTSKWSPDAVQGEKTDIWLQNLDTHSYEEILKISSIMGFTGIALYYDGFEEESLIQVKEILEKYLGEAIVENENNSWCYYTMSYYTNDLKSRYTDIELEHIKNEFENLVYGNYNYNKLYCTNPVSTEEEGILLVPGAIQYGPYIRLEGNKYIIKIEGKNLSKMDFDCIGDRKIDIIDIIEHTDDSIIYKININEDTNSVEFRVFNNTNENAVVKNISYYKDLGNNNELIYHKFLGVN